MKRVLLTGSTGFIGRHCIPYLLEKGYEIHTISHEIFYDREKIQKIKPTHILFFAWYTDHGKYWNSVENLKCVQSALELVINSIESIEKMVFAGTWAEYDWNSYYFYEDSVKDPNSLYGVCKNSLNNILTRYTKDLNISYAWGRIFGAYGPYENKNRIIPYTIQNLLKDKYVIINNGDQTRDYMYVKDVVRAFVAILENDIQGDVNIASGHSIRLKDIICNIAIKMNKKNLIRFDDNIEDNISTNINSTNNNGQLYISADVTKLNSTGFKPIYSLDEGLNETIDWWKKHES